MKQNRSNLSHPLVNTADTYNVVPICAIIHSTDTECCSSSYPFGEPNGADDVSVSHVLALDSDAVPAMLVCVWYFPPAFH